MSSSFKERLDECKNLVEHRLNEIFSGYEDKEQALVLDAMKYSVLNGGKRIRAFLLMETAKSLGCSDEKSVDIACSVEMVHAYSLIHDDMPCMDDDDFRRGLPSCHKKFGEGIACLAGDGLQTMAFENLSSEKVAENFGYEKALKFVRILSGGIGENGMLGGQTIDINGEGSVLSNETHLKMVSMKTAALIKTSVSLGTVCAGREDLIPLLAEYAENLGIAFQIEDDILDVVGSSEKLGKKVGKDASKGKNTFPQLYGLEEARKMNLLYNDKAVRALKKAGFADEILIEAANYLAGRNY